MDHAGLRLRPRGVAVYDVANRACLRSFQLDESPGTILGIGRRYVLSLYRHPKLIDLSTGKVIHVWTELRSGVQDGSIVGHLEGAANPPPMAFDPATGRFAVANGDAVTLIRFSPSAAGAR